MALKYTILIYKESIDPFIFNDIISKTQKERDGVKNRPSFFYIISKKQRLSNLKK